MTGPVLTPLFDGVAGEAAAVTPLLSRRSPELVVELRTEKKASIVVRGLAATPESGSLLRSFDRVCERICDLLVQGVARFAAGALDGALSEPAKVGAAPALASAVAFASRGVAQKIAMRLARPLIKDEHWRIAWRRTRGDAISQTLAWPPSDFTFLPDDGTRFYADPFVVWRDGLAYVFCEEYPYATGKGVISLFTIDEKGVASTPRVIIDRPYHLSYPFIFERDGETFMIPETSGNNTIELYRARSFPDDWEFVRVLVSDVNAGDATLIERDGRFWIFAALSDGERSTWDTLGIFHAPALEGPWQAHTQNPVLIDAGCARPAGRMFEFGGALIRPAQDCRTGYGVGLALCRIDRLDPDEFGQSVVRRFGPPPGTGEHGLHTLNDSGPYEVIDTKGWRRQF